LLIGECRWCGRVVHEHSLPRARGARAGTSPRDTIDRDPGAGGSRGRDPRGTEAPRYCCDVRPTTALTLDEIDLNAAAFWDLPWDARERAFELLRNERPMPHFADPVIEDFPFEVPEGTGYYALTRHRDITTASRHPERFISGKGAVSLIDLPEEM